MANKFSPAPISGTPLDSQGRFNTRWIKWFFDLNTYLNAATGSIGSAAGATTQVQFNISGALTGNANFTYDPSTNTITISATKIGLFNATPVVQQTTGIASAAYVTGASAATFHTDDKYGGYTMGQVVTALKAIGILA